MMLTITIKEVLATMEVNATFHAATDNYSCAYCLYPGIPARV